MNPEYFYPSLGAKKPKPKELVLLVKECGATEIGYWSDKNYIAWARLHAKDRKQIKKGAK
jgi:hypothetical protein